MGRALRAREGTLIAACERGDFAKVEKMILNSSTWFSSRAKYINTLDEKTGNGALHIICVQGSWGISIAELLLKNNADPLLADKSFFAGYTPVHYAAASGEVSLLNLILDHCVERWTGISPTKKNRSKLLVSHIPKVRALVNVRGYHNRVPLHQAAENNHINSVRWLLSFKADANCKDQETKCSALHIAASKGLVEITN